MMIFVWPQAQKLYRGVARQSLRLASRVSHMPTTRALTHTLGDTTHMPPTARPPIPSALAEPTLSVRRDWRSAENGGEIGGERFPENGGEIGGEWLVVF